MILASGEQVTPEENEQFSEFERIWDACREDPTVDIKLARLNILTLETASLYVFRKDGLPVTSRLPMKPKELSAVRGSVFSKRMRVRTPVRLDG